MILNFTKYQGTGNDFVVIDHRNEKFIDHSNKQLISRLCDRRFGIGADGMILLEKSDKFDFEMVYFNSDGGQSSMCGNGGRCLIHFAWKLGLFEKETKFNAIDGCHLGKIIDDKNVSLQMNDVKEINEHSSCFVLNTGSPHFVKFVDEMPSDVKKEGSAIRFSEAFKAKGINVNFVKKIDHTIEVATYERGVEDETFSCGTGVTAAALSAHSKYQLSSPINIQTKGGKLKVSFENENGTYKNIWLSGPAIPVFKGQVEIL